MPKQSLKKPRFRCNHCKEYHSAPEHMTMYQCASHGYLCEKCIVTDKSTIDLFFYDKKSSNRTAKFPEKYIGFCNLDGNMQFKSISTVYSFFNSDLSKKGLNPNSKDEQVIDCWRERKKYDKPDMTWGCKKTIRYDWDIDNNVWIEEGTAANSSEKSTKKNTNILLLVELFENNSISKIDFLKSIKAQLN